MAIEYTGRDRDITVVLGEEFVIALDSNPTTGYEWQIHFDGSMLQLIGREPPTHGIGVGSGGIERFRLKALAAGETALELMYKRAWETIAAEDIVFHVHVRS